MDSMRSLTGSLPSAQGSVSMSANENVLGAFKDAALQVTNLYRAAVGASSLSREEGYRNAIDELLNFLDSKDLGHEPDSEGFKVRQWAAERLLQMSDPGSMGHSDDEPTPTQPGRHQTQKDASSIRHQSQKEGLSNRHSFHAAPPSNPEQFGVKEKQGKPPHSSHPAASLLSSSGASLASTAAIDMPVHGGTASSFSPFPSSGFTFFRPSPFSLGEPTDRSEGEAEEGSPRAKSNIYNRFPHTTVRTAPGLWPNSRPSPPFNPPVNVNPGSKRKATGNEPSDSIPATFFQGKRSRHGA